MTVKTLMEQRDTIVFSAMLCVVAFLVNWQAWPDRHELLLWLGVLALVAGTLLMVVVK